MPDAKISSDPIVTLESTDFLPAIRGTTNVRVAGSDFSASSPLIAEYIVGSGTDSGTTHYVGGGSAVSSINISDLDGVADGGYVVDVNHVCATGINAAVRIFLNNDQTNANYLVAYKTLYDSTTLGNGSADYPASTTNVDVGYTAYTRIEMSDNGTVIAVGFSPRFNNHTAFMHEQYSQKKTLANVTSINLVATIAESIGVGSTVRIRGKK